MQNSDNSFSKVVGLVVFGAVVATVGVFIQDWRQRESAPVAVSAASQQQAPASYSRFE
jgi:hypothetical protein